jgi:hypothetical protein
MLGGNIMSIKESSTSGRVPIHNATQGDSPLVGFPEGGFPLTEFPAMSLMDQTQADIPKEGAIPRNVRFYEGTSRLNKSEMNYAWKEFGGDSHAVTENDGSSYITRIIERESKKNGVYFKLTERLVRAMDGYGTIVWRVEFGAIVRRRSAKAKFEELWAPNILNKVRDVVIGGVAVSVASKELAASLGVPFSTIRANLWVANKWAKGETTTFLPHRSMIESIFDLLVDLGFKDQTIQSMKGYCSEVPKPSEHVLAVLRKCGELNLNESEGEDYDDDHTSG